MSCCVPLLPNLIKRYVASVPDDLRTFGGNGLLTPGHQKILDGAAKIDPRTGQIAFSELVRIHGADFDYAGAGSVMALPS